MKLDPLLRIPRSEFDPSRCSGPAIVLSNVSDWEALQRWSPSYLKSVAGREKVAIRRAKGSPQNIFHRLEADVSVPFSEYLDWTLETANRLDDIVRNYDDVCDISREVSARNIDHSYYLDVRLADLSNMLLKDVVVPEWFDKAPSDILFWCGVIGTSSGLHSDENPNCNVQIIGSKHFILFPPSQTDLFDRIPGRTHCRFDPNLPDFDRFPLAKAADGCRGTLNPGESLYIPAGWYHQVTVISNWAVNVNFFWPPVRGKNSNN